MSIWATLLPPPPSGPKYFMLALSLVDIETNLTSTKRNISNIHEIKIECKGGREAFIRKGNNFSPSNQHLYPRHLNLPTFGTTASYAQYCKFCKLLSRLAHTLNILNSHLEFGKIISTYNFLPHMASHGHWLKAFG